MRIITIMLALIIAGCASKFTEEAVSNLRIGMPASEIKEAFGSPREVQSAVCGGATPGGQWICETWTYKDAINDKVSSFTFSVKQDGKYLNSWRVTR